VVDTRIAVLPATVIDQIAAGEVIERPASVVRELVDNAIDAGARKIVIDASHGGGGKGSITVVDDGHGMSPKDAVLAFERHATSKLRAVDDLWGLTTLGFRGEAMPSIASVSRMTLTTRQAGDLAATRVQIEGGRLVSVTEVGAPVGTCVEVADLFYNVPARLKFLKGEGTEASHITDFVARVAMVHHGLHLRLRHNGRIALDVPPDRDGFARAQALLGHRIAARMIETHGEENGIRVIAYLGAPELGQTTARGVQLFAGKRPVRDRGLLHAVAMGYGELIPRGRYPLAVMMVDAPPSAVDVNVHPQKQEVRFSDANTVCAAVRHIVQAGVERAPWRGESSSMMVTAIASVAPPALPFDPAARNESGLLHFGGTTQLGLSPRAWTEQIQQRLRSARAAERRELAYTAKATDAVPVDDIQIAEGSDKTPAPGFFSTLRYLGQLDLTYLVCEAEGELVLIDQHIAHERVELARLKAGTSRDTVQTQRMLFPTTIEVKPELVELATRMADVLAQVGYEAEGFGKTTLAVKAVPGGIRHGDPTQLLRALLEEWADQGAPDEAERLDRVFAEIACHSVVRAGDCLSTNEAEALLRSMDGADFTSSVHGRPVLLRLPLAEIARRFGR
jgi:DNA mismatch repair protein MutL